LRGVDPLVCMHCSASGNMPCQACLTNGVATGLRKCYYCKGSARGKCRTCQGQFRLKCSRCSGKGKVYTGTRRSGGVYYKVYAKCSTCRGLGVTHRSSSSYSARPGSCPTCSKLQPESRRGTGPCTYCSGKGGSGTCYTCKGSKTAVCTHCPAGRAISPSRTRSSSTRRPRPPKRPRTSTPSTPTDRSIRKKPKSETGSKSRD
jgi:hypothetical protein